MATFSNHWFFAEGGVGVGGGVDPPGGGGGGVNPPPVLGTEESSPVEPSGWSVIPAPEVVRCSPPATLQSNHPRLWGPQCLQCTSRKGLFRFNRIVY